MATGNENGEVLSLWQQALGAIVFLVITVAGMVQRYFTKKKRPEAEEHEILIAGQAEITDLRPMRMLSEQLRELSVQMQKEFPAVRQESREMLEILHRIDLRVGNLEEEQRVQRRAEEMRLRDRMAAMQREERDSNR
jgi:hypothetical protein